MTFASSTRPRPAGPRRRRGPLIPTLLVLAAIVVIVLILAQVWTEVLWYQQLGFVEVIRTEWGTRALLGLAGFLIMGGAVWWSLSYGYRSRPVYAPSTQEQANLDQYREAVEPLRRLVLIVAPVIVGLFAGGAASQQWATIQLWMHGSKVGTADPQYGIDLGFYLFTLPGLRFVVSFLLAVTVLAGIAGVATQYLYGGLRIGGPKSDTPRTTKAARVHLSVIGAVLMLLVAANYWLDRYSILTKTREKFEGAAYTDVHAVIPSKAILAGIAVFVAITFIVTAARGNWRLPLIGVGLMVIAAIAVGGIYPAVVQRFQVQPNQQDAESEYIERNIEATKAAYGLNDVDVQPYSAVVTAEKDALRQDAETTASIRLLDPQIVSPSFKQLQANKNFYQFPDSLSVDKYTIDGKTRDTVIAVRDLNLAGLSAQQRNWTNDTTVYTHGYGVAAAYGNTTAPGGAPAFWEADIPSTGDMGPYEPRIYFGPTSPAYSIVGVPEGKAPWELDYPGGSTGSVNTAFPTDTVSAGPDIGNPINKLLYAIKFGSEQILFSDRVTSASQVLYDRSPRDRVAKVAPYLTLDGRTYPAVVDGHVVWIVDGYTTSDQYPYAASRSLENATTDSLTETSTTIQALQPKTVNYIRNSVKATVDAYSGKVTLYAWDPEDPVLKAWSKVFPTSLEPVSKISSALMSHIRYPEDLFKVQRTLLSRYHVTDPAQFFVGNDFWTTPDDPNHARTPQPPYYLTMQMPDQDAAKFSLTSTFIPAGEGARNVLTGYLAVDAEAGDVAGKPSSEYGKLRLLELTSNTSVPGPGQMSNIFSTDPDVAQELNILSRGGSTVVKGNLLTLPVGGGLLYVQPVYVQAAGTGTSYPLLQRVIVGFGDKVGFAATLDKALDDVFGGDSGADAGDKGSSPGTPTTPTPSPTATPTPGATATPTPAPTSTGTPATARADLDKALKEANDAVAAGQKALADGDFAAYGAAQDRLDKAIQDALDAEARLGE
ncbi:UPF0182 family membrane protein [Cellulomonas edaphi]|uniref:UPF0182 protein QRT05_11065 n=1 Tax=Cellulomonas edaphi TaxID=3053468 RepID=A0ABT7SA86_9CELL|nr:UPF0182 family protein [Cellulomons edaphi]MDM7831874.1 UPF0182 family protein [Cellulomons edaphi]